MGVLTWAAMVLWASASLAEEPPMPVAVEGSAIVQRTALHGARLVLGPGERYEVDALGRALLQVALSAQFGDAIVGMRLKGVSDPEEELRATGDPASKLGARLGGVRLRRVGGGEPVIRLEARGPGLVTAGDIQAATETFKIANPGYVIAKLLPGKTLDIELFVARGRGENRVKQNARYATPGEIPLASRFNPVVSGGHEVVAVPGPAQGWQVVVELETDGTVEPEAVLKEAAATLIRGLSVVKDPTMTVLP